MPDLTYSVNRLAKTSARYNSSALLPSSSAVVIIGTDTVKPWLPEPEQITTGNGHPLIRASDPAAARALHFVSRDGFSSSNNKSWPILEP